MGMHRCMVGIDGLLLLWRKEWHRPIKGHFGWVRRKIAMLSRFFGRVEVERMLWDGGGMHRIDAFHGDSVSPTGVDVDATESRGGSCTKS